MKNLSLRFLKSTTGIAIGVVLLMLAGAPVLSLAAEGNLPPATAQQIGALLQEKASRTATQRKLDSQLLYGIRMSRGEPVAPGVPTQRLRYAIDGNNRVVVDITARVTDALLNQIRQMGGDVVNSVPQFDSVRARLPLGQLEALAASADVTFIQPEVKVLTETGRFTTQGDFTHRAGLARTNFSIMGAGVKVGVLSSSVDFLSSSQNSGDLGNVTILPGQSGVPNTGEGTAMLEIVADLAPKADLFFAQGGPTPAQFAQNIIDLRTVGCDVIVDDVIFGNESPFQDGIIARAVNTVTADGALYFVSGGNRGSKKKGTASTWEGDFNSGGQQTISNISYTVHAYGTNVFNTVPTNGGGGFAVLFWSDPLGASTNDYDLFIVDSANGNVIASSTTAQTGRQDPFEDAGTILDGQAAVIARSSGDARYLHLELFGGGLLTFTTGGSTRGHNSATNAFGVVAVDVARAFPNSFSGGAANPVEDFASDGPRRVFYDPQGNPLTPGNFLSTGGIVRQKPDVAAADGVVTTVPGFAPFFGTSAAAPHAAAIAALIKSYNPALTPQQIRFALTNTALDIEDPGVDPNSGWGIVMPLAALQSLPTPLPVLVASNLSGGNLNGQIDFNECSELDLTIRNDAISTAFGVSATLSTTTLGVTIVQGVSAYPNLPPGASAVNLVPFRFYTAPNFSCGTPINFSFRISSSAGILTNSFRFKTGAVGPLPAMFTNNTVFDIPDNVNAPTNFVDVPIDVANVFGSLGKVAVSVHIVHPSDVDLTLQLFAPDGTRVDLARNRGGVNANYGLGCAQPTTFDDDAATNILSAFAPFVGTFAPQQSLTAFSGKSGNAINGTWRLRVRDSINSLTGNVQCVKLSLFPALCTDGGGDCTTDLSVSMTDAPDPVLTGSNLTYTIVITNLTSRVAPVTTLQDTLPPGVNVVSFTTSRGTCSASPGSVNCSLGTVPGGGGATVRVVVRPTVAGTIVNNVSVSSVATDVNPANNSASTTTLVRAPSPIIVAFSSTLVAESFAPPSGGIEPGETVTINFALRNIGTLDTTTNTSAKLISSNGIAAPTDRMIFGRLIASGPPVSRPFTFTAIGNSGETVTAAFSIQDGTNDLGIVTFTFGLGGSATYANQSVIAIPDSGPSPLYPSTIPVSGIAGVVSKVTVTVSNLSHSFPEDIDMLLVGPTGQKVILMSDAGASRSISGVTLNFDDSANNTLPTDSAIVSGTYRPTDYPPDDLFPAPAPAGPYATTLSAFNGLNPNGTWSLYVFDDYPGDAGRISGGWNLSIATFDPVNPRADLAVSVTDSPDPVKLSSNITYTVIVTNAGPEVAPSVMLTNVLAPGVTFVSAVASQGSCTNDSGIVLCDLGIIDVSNRAVVTIVATVNTVDTQTFTASVEDVVMDFNLANNTATATTSVSAAADLAISATASPNPGVVDNALSYFITVTNKGPNGAFGVSVTQQLPTGYTLDTMTPSQGSCTVAGGNVNCDLGSLASGGTATIAVSGTTPPGVGVLTSLIGVIASSPADPVSSNNSITLSITNLNPSFIIVASTAYLVSESGPITGGIDPGETVAIDFYLRNIGTDITLDLVADIVPNANVLAPGPAQHYGLLEPNGAAIGRTNTFTAGPNSGVITVTLHLQEGSFDLGTVDFTFPLGNTASFSQPDNILIPDFGAASPYPSTINVSGLTGTVGSVTVTIPNLNHTYPDDLDILLVGPGNRMTMLMSDAGGGAAVANLSLTFDDSAPVNLPDTQLITSGTYKPTDYDSLDTLPPPAPSGPYTASLATFRGLDPNGVWSLYVSDGFFRDAGRIIGGWTLNVTTVGLVQPEPSFLAARPMNQSGQFDFLLKGEPGGIYQIEVSTNLLNWTPISTNTLNSGTLMFHDPLVQTSKQRFYRALRKL